VHKLQAQARTAQRRVWESGDRRLGRQLREIRHALREAARDEQEEGESAQHDDGRGEAGEEGVQRRETSKRYALLCIAC
jgi:hypothetical protein